MDYSLLNEQVSECIVDGNLTKLIILYSQGANTYFEPYLSYAILNDHLSIVAFLISQQTYDKETLNQGLSSAVNYGSYSIVEYLITHGADIDAYDNGILYNAINYGYIKIVKLLVEHGADIHFNNDTAIRLARKNRQLAMIEYIQNLP